MDDCDDPLVHTTTNFKAYHVDAYDSDCDDEATACVIFMVPHNNTYHEDTILNDVVQETVYNDHTVFNDNSCDELMSNSNIISYADYMVTIENDAAQYVPPTKQDKNAMILFVTEQMKYDTKSDTEIPKRHVSPTTSTPEIPTAPILPSPSAIVAPLSEALTVRKSVRPLHSYRLALRTPWCSEAYLCWKSASLSTMYPSMTFESSAGDSFFKSSVGPSSKRCRSPTATVNSSIHFTRALVPSRTDLLLPNKKFRDSISLEDSVKEDIDTDVLEDINVDSTVIEVAVDRDVEAGIDVGIGMEVDVGIDVEDEVESSDRGTMEVGVDVDARINIPDGMLMLDVWSI
nr:hypothetical protein [Tanacetum cinerariifolium]